MPCGVWRECGWANWRSPVTSCWSAPASAGVSHRHATLRGGCGSAGSLIPPHEYHTLRNASDDALAISVHVYESQMERSAVFDPLGGDWYQRRIQALQADPA